ncbi:UPF0057-domain-containing protein [Byssothecium circinans]|uniref:UPF0057-domain-containing protein n=1 Tax=Byssothecium circinans TaxID=147558 RepID=A0A6A5T8A7_9PLEO|nr:UPF0057-domain-containing protein [Byssothecium circinans]
MCGTDCLLMLLSVLFPPIGVWVKRGICSADSLINLGLSCLGFLPGLIHAWYIILQYPDPYEYEGVQDRERGGDGSVTYYYVHRPAPQHPAGRQQAPAQQGQTTYGTVGGSHVDSARKAVSDGDRAVSGSGNGEGSAEGSEPSGPPPTYADVIKGDHKVQKP